MSCVRSFSCQICPAIKYLPFYTIFIDLGGGGGGGVMRSSDQDDGDEAVQAEYHGTTPE